MRKNYIILIFLFWNYVSLAQSVALNWAKSFGSTGNDSGNSIAVDASGNVFTTGTFSGTVDFDPGPGTYYLTASNYDMFISKLDAADTLVWAKNIGGANTELGNSIIVDSGGNVYTTGVFVGTADFDPGAGVYNLTSNGSYDIFVSKLDASGNFIWAKSFGGPNLDSGNSIAADASGNVCIVGTFTGTVDFDPGAPTYNLSSGSNDVFISKLDVNGSFLWAKQFSGVSYENGSCIAIDGSGNIYTTGYFNGTTDFDPSQSVYTITPAGGNDAFVSKLDPSGSLVWVKSINGPSNDQGNSIALDVAGNIYVTGWYGSTTDFDPGAAIYNLTPIGGIDTFVWKLDPTGSFLWAKSVGGANNDYGQSVTSDLSGNVYYTGWFNGTADFDPGVASINLISSGSDDVFVSKLDAAGAFVWAVNMGGASTDEGFGISIDGSGNVYSVGYFTSVADFDPGPAVFNITSAGLKDVFIVKLSELNVGLIEKTYSTNDFNIYPNPTNGSINFDFLPQQTDNLVLSVENITGQQLISQNFKGDDAKAINQISLNNLSNGIYFVKITNDKGNLVKTQKVILNR